MEITFDLVQSMGIVAIVYILGSFIKKKVSFFQKYFIPAPVIGGIIFSILVFIGARTGLYNIVVDTILQDFMMNVFFCAVGFTCSISIIKKSGKQGAILAIVAVAFLFVQNIVGILLAKMFGIHELLGVAMGSISMSGGVGSAASFGPTLEMFGAEGGTTIGVAAATFGLLVGSLIGGPVAGYLIKKYNLKGNSTDINISTEEDLGQITEKSILQNILKLLVTTALGSIIYFLINRYTGISVPYYVGCLFSGMIYRNIADVKGIELNMKTIDMIGNISLNLFLTLALMNLNISKLISLAGPMIAILIVQTIVMAFWAYYVTFGAMGKDYEAAVMAAGHCGVGLGQTPNAIANMSAVIEKNGPAPNAWFVLPVITVVFINIFNPIVITFFINLFS